MKSGLKRNMMVAITALSVTVAVGAVGYADSALKQITAYQNAALNITVNGSKVDLSSEEGMKKV
ncbi:hypothetical protein [Paenibacillus xerothermodurans]|uniref:hypothetical protein n=1 Tax=Paenibacillus xerothermodurans TaxID=1977292 RepID=UPI001FB1D049|nr:hypothetical protein [Paenibacillus xerothermodurans]